MYNFDEYNRRLALASASVARHSHYSVHPQNETSQSLPPTHPYMPAMAGLSPAHSGHSLSPTQPMVESNYPGPGGENDMRPTPSGGFNTNLANGHAQPVIPRQPQHQQQIHQQPSPVDSNVMLPNHLNHHQVHHQINHAGHHHQPHGHQHPPHHPHTQRNFNDPEHQQSQNLHPTHPSLQLHHLNPLNNQNHNGPMREQGNNDYMNINPSLPNHQEFDALEVKISSLRN